MITRRPHVIVSPLESLRLASPLVLFIHELFALLSEGGDLEFEFVSLLLECVLLRDSSHSRVVGVTTILERSSSLFQLLDHIVGKIPAETIQISGREADELFLCQSIHVNLAQVDGLSIKRRGGETVERARVASRAERGGHGRAHSRAH